MLLMRGCYGIEVEANIGTVSRRSASIERCCKWIGIERGITGSNGGRKVDSSRRWAKKWRYEAKGNAVNESGGSQVEGLIKQGVNRHRALAERRVDAQSRLRRVQDEGERV